jgi:hypothetical protein
MRRKFFAPGPEEQAGRHFGAPGGVLPELFEERAGFYRDPAVRGELEAFFERPMGL